METNRLEANGFELGFLIKLYIQVIQKHLQLGQGILKLPIATWVTFLSVFGHDCLENKAGTK